MEKREAERIARACEDITREFKKMTEELVKLRGALTTFVQTWEANQQPQEFTTNIIAQPPADGPKNVDNEPRRLFGWSTANLMHRENALLKGDMKQNSDGTISVWDGDDWNLLEQEKAEEYVEGVEWDIDANRPMSETRRLEQERG